MYTYIQQSRSLCCSEETNTILYSNYTPKEKESVCVLLRQFAIEQKLAQQCKSTIFQ